MNLNRDRIGTRHLGLSFAQSEQAAPSLGSATRFVESLFRYPVRFWLLFLAGVLGTVAFVQSRVPTYASEAKVLIKKSITDALAEDPEFIKQGRSPDTSSSFVEVHLTLLGSREVHEAAVTDLLKRGVLKPPAGSWSSRVIETGEVHASANESDAVTTPTSPAFAATLAAFTKKLSVGLIPGTSVVHLKFEDRDPAVAREVLDTLIHHYEYRYRDLNDLGPVVREWSAEESGAAARLSEVRDARNAFLAKHGLFDIDAQRAGSLKALATYEARYDEAHVKIGGLDTRIEEAEKVLAATPALLEPEQIRRLNPQRKALEDQIYQHRMELHGVTASSPRAATIKERLDELTRKLDAEPEYIVEHAPRKANPLHEEINRSLIAARIDRAATQAEMLRIQESLRDERDEVARMERLPDELKTIDAALAKAEEDHREKRDRLDYLRRSQNLDAARVIWTHRVIQQPTLPLQSPDQKRIAHLAVGIALSLAAALLAVFLSGVVFDRTVRRPEDLVAVGAGAPAATIQELDHAIVRRALAARPASGRKGAPAEALPAHIPFMAQELESTHAADRLDRALGRYLSSRGPAPTAADKLIVFAGVRDGEGTTTMAVNAAARLARKADFKVLFVDWHRRAAGAGPDVAGVTVDTVGVAGIKVEIVRSSHERVDVIAPRSLDALWASQRVVPFLQDFIAQVVPQYDVVVFDAAPATLAGETQDVLRHGAFAFLVVRAGHMGAARVRDALATMSTPPARPLGVILNGYHSYLPAFLDRRASSV